MQNTCKKCLYFKTRQGTGKLGECRRYPKVSVSVREGSIGMFTDTVGWKSPTVKPTEWCGEFSYSYVSTAPHPQQYYFDIHPHPGEGD